MKFKKLLTRAVMLSLMGGLMAACSDDNDESSVSVFDTDNALYIVKTTY